MKQAESSQAVMRLAGVRLGGSPGYPRASPDAFQADAEQAEAKGVGEDLAGFS
jgi:hypothetical protein